MKSDRTYVIRLMNSADCKELQFKSLSMRLEFNQVLAESGMIGCTDNDSCTDDDDQDNDNDCDDGEDCLSPVDACPLSSNWLDTEPPDQDDGVAFIHSVSALSRGIVTVQTITSPVDISSSPELQEQLPLMSPRKRTRAYTKLPNLKRPKGCTSSN
jgi:hypothetical protein